MYHRSGGVSSLSLVLRRNIIDQPTTRRYKFRYGLQSQQNDENVTCLVFLPVVVLWKRFGAGEVGLSLMK